MPGGPSDLTSYQTFLASAARTATGTATAFDTEDWDIITAQVNVTASSGVSPTLVVRIQTTYDNGATWVDIAVTDADITGVTRKILSTAPPGIAASAPLYSFGAADGNQAVGGTPKPIALGTQCRFQWTIAGTTPSFTFAITGMLRRLT